MRFSTEMLLHTLLALEKNMWMLTQCLPCCTLFHSFPVSTVKCFNSYQLLNIPKLKRIELGSLAYEKELKELSLLIKQQQKCCQIISSVMSK